MKVRHIWALDAIQSNYLCSNLCTYLFMHLCERKKSLIIVKCPNTYAASFITHLQILQIPN